MSSSSMFHNVDWPAPSRVRAIQTLRTGGVSSGPYASLNLATHVGDDPVLVARNRQLLIEAAAIPAQPLWLEQVHGIEVVQAATPSCVADASVAFTPHEVCVVMTADCLPVLFCDEEGTRVGAAHAGWRGLAGGVLENTLAHMNGARLMAWLGPAIGPAAFEVGEDVYQAFVSFSCEHASAFVSCAEGKYLADIYQLARTRLAMAGVEQVFGGGECTFTQSQQYYSFRRDKVCGRMATMIWLER